MSIISVNIKFAPCSHSVSYTQYDDTSIFFALYPTLIELNTKLKPDAAYNGLTAQL